MLTQTVTVNYAVTGPLAAIRTKKTPFTGSGLLHLPAVPAGATLLVEQSENGTAWTTKATFPAGSEGVKELNDFQRWTRFNVSVAGTGTADLVLEGKR